MTVSSARITSNTSYYIIALTTQKILAFVYFILIARFLGAEDIGRYALAVSFIQILAIFIDIGLSPSITRESSRDPKRIEAHFSNIIGFKILMSVVAAVILVVLANLFGYSELIKSLLYLAAIVMILDSFTLTFYAMLRGLHILNNESMGVIIYQVMVIAISLIGLYKGADVKILIVALIAGSIFNFGWSLYSLKKSSDIKIKINFQWEKLKPILTIALPFGITAIFIKLYQMGDTILLSLLSDEQELGWYSVAHKLVFAFEFIPLAFVASVFPAMSAFYNTDKAKMVKTFETSSFYLMLISVPIMLGGFALAQPMVVSLYGDDFSPATGSLQVLLLSLVFLFLNYPLSSLLGAINRQKINMYFMGAAALSSIVLNLIFIPKYGGVGASLALFFSLTGLFLLYVCYIHRVVSFSLSSYFRSLRKVFYISFIMTAVVIIVTAISNWFIGLVIGIAFYITAALITKLINKDDILQLYRGLKGRQV